MAVIGIVYGAIMDGRDNAPRLLSDAYPSMTTEKIYNFDYLDRTYTNLEGDTEALIPWSAIVIGSFKVALVAIVETLISALIAQKKYIQKHEETGQ